ncbi:MAG: hypothetical protein AB7Q16_07425 [Vicinamibacterales bacterium]
MKTLPPSIVLVLAALVAGCSSQPDVERVPVGTEVQVVTAEGAVVTGRLAARDEKTVQVEVGAGRKAREVPREQIADVQIVEASRPAPPLPPIARFREVTVPSGTDLEVRLESAVGSDTSRVDDAVNATLSEPVVVDGMTVLPAGSTVRGEVAAAQPAGKVKGRASLALRFGTVTVGDERYAIQARVSRLAPATKKEDAAKIAIPAGAGAVIGGIIGGGKGAAIGTAIGGGAGTAVVLTTSGDEIRLPSGTTLTLQIDSAIEVRVPIATQKSEP